MLNWRKKYGRAPLEALYVVLIIAVAVVLRLFLIAQGWPGTNSDEGTFGLEAMHIAYKGELPIFLYGQNYMGTIESYLAAGAFRLFGVSYFSLRFGMVLLFALFLVAIYLLTRLLYSKTLALVTIGLLCFGSSEALLRELKVLGGDLETILFGSCALLFATWLAYTYQQKLSREQRRKRCVLYGGLGLAWGLGIWSHMLILPFVFVTLLLLALFCRHEIRTRTTLWLVGGLVIGALPLLIFNVQHPEANSLVTLWSIHSSGGTATSGSYSLWDGIVGTVLVALPKATSAAPLCTISSTSGEWRHQVSSCMLFQGAWGVGFLVLLASGLFFTLKDLQLRNWRRAFDPTLELAERQILVLRTARFLLLGVGVLILLSYVTSPAPALVPDTSSRYLVGLLVAIPALIAPLVSISFNQQRPLYLELGTNILRISVLLFILVVLVNATGNVLLQQVPSTQASIARQQRLIDDLQHISATHIYSEYWTCNNLMFQSQEHIICSVLDENLHTGKNRYLPYQTIVQADPRASYVFPTQPQPVAQDLTFKRQLTTSGKQYRHYFFEGYDVYQPQ